MIVNRVNIDSITTDVWSIDMSDSVLHTVIPKLQSKYHMDVGYKVGISYIKVA